jgi:hypothetical protein
MLFQELKKRRMQAMKDKDKDTVSLLGTLIAEASKQNKEPSDDEVLRTVKKFVQSSDETISAMRERGLDTQLQEREKALLEDLLPKQMTEAEIDSAVLDAIAQAGAQSKKDMGAVMAKLKEHGQALDMKVASAKVKEKLQ